MQAQFSVGVVQEGVQVKDEEILQKAIEKAVDNGWSFYNWLIDNWSYPKDFRDHPEQEGAVEEAVKIISKSYFVNIIFSHSFAKAFWGEKDDWEAEETNSPWDGHNQERWQFHLQQMVLEEKPLQYIKEYL